MGWFKKSTTLVQNFFEEPRQVVPDQAARAFPISGIVRDTWRFDGRRLRQSPVYSSQLRKGALRSQNALECISYFDI
jgi:hypothetical protein